MKIKKIKSVIYLFALSFSIFDRGIIRPIVSCSAYKSFCLYSNGSSPCQ